MKHIFYLIIFNCIIFSGFSQINSDSIYYYEVQRIQKTIELNLMYNADLFCNDFIGSTFWIVITKESSLNKSKVRVLTTDQLIRNKFEILRSNQIDINWNIIDKSTNNVMLIQPVAITCLEQERMDNSSLFAFYTMLNTYPEYTKSKMILFKTISVDIGPTRSKVPVNVDSIKKQL